MGIGRETLHRAYRLICDKGTTTRKELSELLEASEVSAGKAAAALIDLGLISVSKGTFEGRKTDLFSASKHRTLLLIDACRKNIAFSLVSPISKIDSIRTVSYLHLRDLDTNLTIAASDIAKFLRTKSITPDVVAVAYAPIDKHPIKELLSYSLSACGIKVDLWISGSVAACEYCSALCGEGETFAFTQINDQMWGFVSDSPDRMLDWSRIKVGNRHGESIGSILSYDTDLDHLLVYFQRFFRAVDSVVFPDRMFVSSSFLNPKLLSELCDGVKVEDLSPHLPILNGLLSLAKDTLFEKTFFTN